MTILIPINSYIVCTAHERGLVKIPSPTADPSGWTTRPNGMARQASRPGGRSLAGGVDLSFAPVEELKKQIKVPLFGFQHRREGIAFSKERQKENGGGVSLIETNGTSW